MNLNSKVQTQEKQIKNRQKTLGSVAAPASPPDWRDGARSSCDNNNLAITKLRKFRLRL